jgi:hypothetical protein
VSGLTTKEVVVVSPPVLYVQQSLSARLAVLTAAAGMASALLALDLNLVVAITSTLVSTAGGVEVGCRLTAPYPAPKVRIGVLVIILVFVVSLLAVGYHPAVCIGTVLAAGWCAAAIARRVTGAPLRLPRLVYPSVAST